MRVDVNHKIVVFPENQPLEDASPHGAEINLEPWTAVRD